jgi:hypothetical protein
MGRFAFHAALDRYREFQDKTRDAALTLAGDHGEAQ